MLRKIEAPVDPNGSAQAVERVVRALLDEADGTAARRRQAARDARRRAEAGRTRVRLYSHD